MSIYKIMPLATSLEEIKVKIKMRKYYLTTDSPKYRQMMCITILM